MGPLLAGWIFCTVIGWAVGTSKGRGVEGFFLGALLGPLGILLAAIMKPTVELQAKRDVELEHAREAERERWREEGRAQVRAEAEQTYRTEIG